MRRGWCEAATFAWGIKTWQDSTLLWLSLCLDG